MEMLAPFFGLFTSFILFYYRKDFNRSNLYLALFYLCSNLIVLVYFGLHFSKTPFWEGVFFVQFMPLSFVIGPLLFFYVKYAVAENKNIAELLAKNDSVGFANSYTEDAKFMEHNLPALVGRAAIQSFWSKFMIAGGNDIQLNTLEVWGDAATITEEGLYELKSNKGAVLGKGKYIVIWKSVNGKWLIHRDISNSDLPATK